MTSLRPTASGAIRGTRRHEKKDGSLTHTMGEILEYSFNRDINWTGLCRIAALSFSHYRSKLRTFQLSVSLLNLFIRALSVQLASLLNTL